MPTATIERNNRAFVELSVPFDAAVTENRVYVASGPNEVFALKATFPHANVAGKSRFFWNHMEFGFRDDGVRYSVQVTEVKGGVESPRISSQALEIPRSLADTSIPILVKKVLSDAVFTNAATLGDFIVSVGQFRSFRLIFDALVNAQRVEFQIETAQKRAGPFRTRQIVVPQSDGTVDIRNGTFRIDSTRLGDADFEASEVSFVRLRARQLLAADANQLGVDMDRVGRNR